MMLHALKGMLHRGTADIPLICPEQLHLRAAPDERARSSLGGRPAVSFCETERDLYDKLSARDLYDKLSAKCPAPVTSIRSRAFLIYGERILLSCAKS